VRWAAEKVPAILEAWLPGEMGGQAVAEVLFGRYNPSGRLPLTFPRHAGQLPAYYNYKPSKEFSLKRTGYVDLPAGPLWEFGFGLSYTTFRYFDLRINPVRIGPTGEVEVSLNIENSGPFEGQAVVQLYLRDEISSVVTPVKELKGFQKISLKPGEKQRVRFKLNREQFSLLDEHLRRKAEPGLFEVQVGASSQDIRLKGHFELLAK